LEEFGRGIAARDENAGYGEHRHSTLLLEFYITLMPALGGSE